MSSINGMAANASSAIKEETRGTDGKAMIAMPVKGRTRKNTAEPEKDVTEIHLLGLKKSKNTVIWNVRSVIVINYRSISLRMSRGNAISNAWSAAIKANRIISGTDVSARCAVRSRIKTMIGSKTAAMKNAGFAEKGKKAESGMNGSKPGV